jgi:hypothetical protein
MRILELTDSFNISRQSVIIPLVTEEKGSITMLPDGHLRIVCPEDAKFEAWIKDLRDRLENMGLSRIGKASDEHTVGLEWEKHVRGLVYP